MMKPRQELRRRLLQQEFGGSLHAIRLLATFGETGWFGGLAPRSDPEEGRKTRVIPEGKFLDFSRGGAYVPHFTKRGQEP
jgi:hypothetical protein